MWGRGQRNKVMKYGEGPRRVLSMGPERPRYATAHMPELLLFFAFEKIEEKQEKKCGQSLRGICPL